MTGNFLHLIFRVRITSTFSVLRPKLYFDPFCTSTGPLYFDLFGQTLLRPKLYFDLFGQTLLRPKLYFDPFTSTETVLRPFLKNASRPIAIANMKFSKKKVEVQKSKYTSRSKEVEVKGSKYTGRSKEVEVERSKYTGRSKEVEVERSKYRKGRS